MWNSVMHHRGTGHCSSKTWRQPTTSPYASAYKWHMYLIAALRGPFPCFDLFSHKESKYQNAKCCLTIILRKEYPISSSLSKLNQPSRVEPAIKGSAVDIWKGPRLRLNQRATVEHIHRGLKRGNPLAGSKKLYNYNLTIVGFFYFYYFGVWGK